MNSEAIKELLLKMADDALIIGHRNSEWTGIGPMLEEDLAFSSMAQDKIGHALALYQILHDEFGMKKPDELAFMRDEKEFRCCQFVEWPIGEYDFSLIRHFLFDHAEWIRYDRLSQSSFIPIQQLARKVKGEIKYHVMHADTFLKQLSGGSEEAHARMQSALNVAWPLAQGIFEPGDFEKELEETGVFVGEKALKQEWMQKVSTLLSAAGLKIPGSLPENSGMGGRKGFHSEYLAPLLDEMCEVIRIDPGAEW